MYDFKALEVTIIICSVVWLESYWERLSTLFCHSSSPKTPQKPWFKLFPAASPGASHFMNTMTMTVLGTQDDGVGLSSTLKPWNPKPLNPEFSSWKPSTLGYHLYTRKSGSRCWAGEAGSVPILIRSLTSDWYKGLCISPSGGWRCWGDHLGGW